MPKARNLALLAALALVGGAAVLFVITSYLKKPLSRGKLLSTTVGDTAISLHDNGSFDLTLELHIDRGNTHQTEYVIDKSTYGTVRFIRYKDDILAANDQYIFASYNIPSQKITRYADLPFTVWTSQGQILSTYRFSDGAAEMRHDFPFRLEPTSTQP